MSQTQSTKVKSRTFLARKICQQMKDDDVTELMFIHQLNLTSHDPKDVLIELEKAGKFSSVDNLRPLATIMEGIGRKDLAKEIEQFITRNSRSQKSCKSKTHNYNTLLLISQFTASLQAIQSTMGHLLDQMETMKQMIPDNVMFSKISTDMTKAITNLEEKVQPRISAATRALPQLRMDSDSSSCEDDCFELTSSNVIQDRPLPDLPTLSQKLPIEEEMPPDSDDDDNDEGYERLPVNQSKSSTMEPTTQQEEVRDLTDQPAKTEHQVKPLPPPVPPKPKNHTLRQNRTVSAGPCEQVEQSTGNESTGSGSDSGFIDSWLLQRNYSSSKDKVATGDQQSLYTKLNTEQLDPVATYTAVNTTMSTFSQKSDQ